jgi:hypothetical protein
MLGRPEGAELLGEIDEDRAALEHAGGRIGRTVDHGRDLGVGIDLDEAAGELVALADADHPGVIFGAGMAQREQLLEHDGDLDAIGRAHRVELERCLPTGSACSRVAPETGRLMLAKVPPARLVPGPDLRRTYPAAGCSQDRLRRPLASPGLFVARAT